MSDSDEQALRQHFQKVVHLEEDGCDGDGCAAMMDTLLPDSPGGEMSLSGELYCVLAIVYYVQWIPNHLLFENV